MPERSSVLQAEIRASAACTTSSVGSQTANVASAPGTSTPASSRRAARWAPRVWAAKAARALIRCSGTWWNTAARTPPHGSIRVTGLSEPNASTTPAAAIEPTGFSVGPRSGPSRCAYSDEPPPQRASKAG